jgi:ribose 5-phosphate isomerase B
MKVGLAADHGGFEMKQQLGKLLEAESHEVIDFGNTVYDANDDYPDFTIRLARAVSRGEVERGVLLCGSGVGASVAANKIFGVRAAVCHDDFSARQGVEDDNLNILCFGGRTDRNWGGVGLHQELSQRPVQRSRTASPPIGQSCSTRSSLAADDKSEDKADI